MNIKLLLILIGALALTNAQRKWKTCALRTDIYSPFYWKNSQNVCTKDLCQSYPWLPCGADRDYIMDQAAGHYPEDILMEITYLEKYFNTHMPKPNNNLLEYECTDVCAQNAKPLQLQRIFTEILVSNPYTGLNETQQHMCIIIGPNIQYQQCGGQCQIPYGGSAGHFCVPDVTVSMDVWVYCPDAPTTKCHKVRFDVPMSCSCKHVTCKRAFQTLNPPEWKPNVPPKPVGWVPSDNRFPYVPENDMNHGRPLGHPILPGMNPANPLEIMDMFPSGVQGGMPQIQGIPAQGVPVHGGKPPGNMHIV